MDYQRPQTDGSLALSSDSRADSSGGSSGARMRVLPVLPPVPDKIEGLGLPERFIEDLTLKTLYRMALPTPAGVANALRVAPSIARDAIDQLKHQQMLATTTASGRLESEWQYRLTEKGLHAAEEAFERSRYVGPVPVPIQDYFARLTDDPDVPTADAGRMARALQQLVLGRDVVAKVCLALTSGRPAMLWGAPGNGKTTILELCSEATYGVVLLPIAVYVSGHIIRLYDDLVHVPVAGDDTADLSSPGDRRWLRVKRPFVFVGGELRPEDLDLAYDPALGYHQAPPHVKAHGGLLAIDDFGRQQVSPQQLLNRWIAALERGEDTMTLVTGERITFPFRSTICFSTNLEPRTMLEEAHLRRIPYKIRIPEPTDVQLAELFGRFAKSMGVAYDESRLQMAVKMVDRASEGKLRSCHARDIIQLIVEEGRFLQKQPSLEAGAVRRACDVYFGIDPGSWAPPVAD